MAKNGSIAVILFSAGLMALGTAGCQRTESPEKTQADMAKAATEGERDAAEIRHDAAEATMEAQGKLAHESAEARKDVAKADAETQHKVALEACASLTGDARDVCKKKADLDYDQAKLSADTRAKVEDPTH